ncbi:M20 family metallopeptidase [Actinomadura chibensis]|uniref:Probable succinyl-diaminopimelate desuccinylase n=1 Tax=Actinomadura chibensis TaxID=392828 RepID=A0A5D0NPW7_9ACTN|nr:ArgE/DapE family deacylase [Actinomadura chibensis]TYB46352.1 M20 family metallopeptidase [Actinomadura chibensis]
MSAPEEYVSTERVVETTRALVRCDSQNPPGREAAVAATATALLAERGCAVELFEPEPGRPSVLGRYAADSAPGAPTLLVNGHLDVVPVAVDAWTRPPFDAVREGDRLYGRGAADMKGGIAAALEGLSACRDAGVPVPSRLLFHLVADEETGGRHGTEALVDAGLVDADACLIPEPTGLRASIAERGSVQVRVRVRGAAGHGSEPGAGRSAIADAAAMITALHGTAYHERPHPLLGSPSGNVALIDGGVAANVIAPHCAFVIDRRTLPGESAADVLAGLRTRIDAACPGADYEMEALVEVEASELRADHPFARFVAASANTVPTGLSLGTDGRFLRNRLGIPTVVYGPGAIAQAHTADEWVSVAELTAAARAFARVFATFGRDDAGPRLP